MSQNEYLAWIALWKM